MPARPPVRRGILESQKDRIWTLGAKIRYAARRLGVLPWLDPLVLRLAPLVLRPPATDTEVVLPEEMKMVVPAGFPSARSYATGSYEPSLTKLLQRKLQPGTSFVDLGANIGYYTLLASFLVGSKGRVYAFEPDARNFEYLTGNVAMNGLENVQACRKAALDGDFRAAFRADRFGAEGWVSVSMDAQAESGVETTSLDQFFSSLGWPALHLVKMDIEGSEVRAMRGMKQVVAHNPGVSLVVEFNPSALARAGSSREEFIAALQSLGFSVGYLVEENLKRFDIAQGFPKSRAVCNLLFVSESSA